MSLYLTEIDLHIDRWDLILVMLRSQDRGLQLVAIGKVWLRKCIVVGVVHFVHFRVRGRLHWLLRQYVLLLAESFHVLPWQNGVVLQVILHLEWLLLVAVALVLNGLVLADLVLVELLER